MHRTGDIVDVQMGIERPGFRRRDFRDIDIEGAGERGLAVDFLLALFGQRHGNRSVLAHAGGDAGFFLQPDIEFGGVFREARQVLAGPQLADQARGVPGRAAGQLPALQQDDVFPAYLGEMIGDRAARDAAADNDGPRPGG